MIPPPVWGAVATTSALAAVLVTTLDAGPPVRPVVVFWFLLVCPGLSLVRLLRLGSPALEIASGIAVSIAVGAVVSQALLYAGWWSPLASLLLVVLVTLAAVAVELAAPVLKASRGPRA